MNPKFEQIGDRKHKLIDPLTELATDVVEAGAYELR